MTLEEKIRMEVEMERKQAFIEGMTKDRRLGGLF